MKLAQWQEETGYDASPDDEGVIFDYPQYSHVDEGMWSPWFDEDHWRQNWWGTRVYVDPDTGDILVDEISVDDDGDADYGDTYPWEEYNDRYDRLVRECYEQQDEYYHHVAETGEDPLGEFLAGMPETVTDHWEIHLRREGVDIRILDVTENGAPVDLDSLPQNADLLSYLGAYRRIPGWYVNTDDGTDWQSIAEHQEFDPARKEIVISTDHTWKRPLPEEIRKAELRRAAERALTRLIRTEGAQASAETA